MKTRRPGAAPALDDAFGFRARARRAGLFPPSRAARLADAFLFPFSADDETARPRDDKNVYMAFDEEEGMDVAWNQVKVNGLPREEKQRLLSEVEILKELDHKNIIKLYHSWIVTEKDEISVNFITEACAQTLKKDAAKLKTNLDLRAVKSWSRQILRGLDYLHSHEPPIVHRDLKCDNIPVNQNQGEVKIGDWV